MVITNYVLLKAAKKCVFLILITGHILVLFNMVVVLALGVAVVVVAIILYINICRIRQNGIYIKI